MGNIREKIKNTLYDKNDLLVALVVLVLAGLVIYNRIGVIMDYPAMLSASASSAETPITTEEPAQPAESSKPAPPVEKPEAPAKTPAAPAAPTTPAAPTPGDDPLAAQPTQEPTKKQVSVYIEYGATGSQIAQLLIDAGLITEKNQFYDAVRAAGAETRLQAGSFKIPANATPAQIIDIITR